jgi:hypothetical protein
VFSGLFDRIVLVERGSLDSPGATPTYAEGSGLLFLQDRWR